MDRGSQILYTHMGKPPVVGIIRVSEPSICWVCGGSLVKGVPCKKWAGTNFVGQNRVKAPSAKYVCPACVYVCSRTSPVPGRPPGVCSACKGVLKNKNSCTKCKGTGKNSFGGNFRNYSHLYDNGTYFNASKAEKHKIRDFLGSVHEGPWFAAIADSGQKHTLPWVPVNPTKGTRGRVLFDDQVIWVPQDQLLIREISFLLTVGAMKTSVQTGNYTAREWLQAEAEILDFERNNGHLRGGAWFSLALWLSQTRSRGGLKHGNS